MQKIFGAVTGTGQPPVNPNTQGQPGQPMPNPTNNLATNAPPATPHSSSQTAPNGVVPPDGSTAPAASPLDKFSKVWETDPTDKSQQTPDANALTPEKMMEAAGKVDFSRVMDQESLTKIAAGGEEAVKALVGIINKTAQTVYGQSTVVSKKLVDQAIEQAEARFTSAVPNLVRRQSMRDGLVTDNPAFNNPAVAPFVSAMEQQLAQKYPNATASELTTLAKEYFAAAAGALNPTKAPASSAAGKGDVDWDDWMNTPLPNG